MIDIALAQRIRDIQSQNFLIKLDSTDVDLAKKKELTRVWNTATEELFKFIAMYNYSHESQSHDSKTNRRDNP